MKTILALLLMFSPVIAHADAIGFVNVNRTINECSDWKRALADLKDAQAARDKAVAAAKAAQKPISPPDKDWKAMQERRLQSEGERIDARATRIVKKIAEAKHLTAVLPAPIYASPKAVDITAEVISRLDAGDGKDEAEAKADETTRLREENARLKAQLAERAKTTATHTSKAP